MKRFKNILVISNDAVGADDALSQATALACANRARLTLVDIVPPARSSHAEISERRKRLQRTVNAVKMEGVDRVAADVLSGTDFIEIIRLVLAGRHDIVIAGSGGGGVVRNTVYGSLATQLMRKCPCPVWISKPGQNLDYGRILAAVDPDLSDPSHDAFNIKIMDLATSLAACNDAELHILHAWDVTGKDRDTITSEIHDKARALLLKKHEGVHRAGVEALLRRYQLSHAAHSVHLPRGLPEWEIVKAVKDHEIDLIVMGTASRSGLSGLLIGNAAESILAAVRCGVLTVKPEGFVSPVMLDHELAVA